MTSNNPPTLEGMAPEIKTIILLNISDLPSLSSIVRASPHMYAIYAADREKFISSIVLPTLAYRGLDLTKPARALELYSHKPDQDVFVPVVHSWYSQLTTGTTKPRLTMKVARSLLRIKLAVTWCMEPNPDISGCEWVWLSRPKPSTLPHPRPDHLCIVGTVHGRRWAFPSLLRLLHSEGYRLTGRKIKGVDDGIKATVMTLEPYDSDNPHD